MSLNPYNDINRYWLWMFAIFVIFLAIIWVYPEYLYFIDPFFVILPWILWLYSLGGHIYPESHIGGYAVVTYRTHTSTSEADWTIEIPPKGAWPRMVVIKTGSGRYGNFIMKGLKESGWLIVPKKHVKKMNKQMVAFTRTRKLELNQISPHIREALTKHPDFHEGELIEIGMDPFYPDIDNWGAENDSFNYELGLTEAHEENALLKDLINDLRLKIKGLQATDSDLKGSKRGVKHPGGMKIGGDEGD